MRASFGLFFAAGLSLVLLFQGLSSDVTNAQDGGEIQARAFYMAALEAVERGEYSEALELVQTATSRMGGGNAQLSALEARAHAGLKDYVAAQRALQDFYGFAPNDALQTAMAPVIVEVERNVGAQRAEQERDAVANAAWIEADRTGAMVREVWEQRPHGNKSYLMDMKLTADGSLILSTMVLDSAGTSISYFLHRMEQDGSFRWTRTADESGEGSIGVLAELDDGSIIAVYGGPADPKTYLPTYSLRKFGADGSYIADIQTDPDMDMPTTIVSGPDNTFVVSGSKFKGQDGTLDPVISQHTADGSIIRRNYSPGPMSEGYGQPMFLSDGRLVVSGTSSSSDLKSGVTFQILLDTDWKSGLPVIIQNRHKQLLAPLLLTDDTIFWSGTAYENYLDEKTQKNFPYQTRRTIEGQIISETSPNYPPEMTVFGMALDSTGDVIAAVHEAPFNVPLLDSLYATKGYLMKIGLDSQPIWRKTFSDEDFMAVSKIVILPDGDIIAAFQARTEVKDEYTIVIKRLAQPR